MSQVYSIGAHSAASGPFNNTAIVRVTLQLSSDQEPFTGPARGILRFTAWLKRRSNP